MTAYKSKSGKKSGVIAYESGDNYIKVLFDNGMWYTYTYQTAGKAAIENMKNLARASQGLSTYIARHNPAFE